LKEPYDYINNIPITIKHDDVHIEEILTCAKVKGKVHVMHNVRIIDVEILDITGRWNGVEGWDIICNYKNTGDSSLVESKELFKVKTRSREDWILKMIGLEEVNA